MNSSPSYQEKVSKPLKLWRNDITGLRALAVLPVLIFHAVPEWIPGGFYGVDIFFVISGYLISGIIFRGLLKDNFSYLDFYVKRIRRIIPNLICLFTFVSIFGWFFLSIEEYKALGKHIYSSAAFYQNFRLLGEGGYFDLDSTAKPLLHLWSLAIEEQFYIVFPLICTGLWAFFKSARSIGWAVLVITASSLVACLLVQDQTFNFYFPLTRFWELGVGIMLAFVETFFSGSLRRLPLPLRHAMSASGFLMILGAMFGYSSQWNAPGVLSMLPVLGAAFLIAAHEDACINRSVLSWRAMTFIGVISYSLYLWHWPFLSFQAITYPMGTVELKLGLLLLSGLVATLIYYFVENPMRRWNVGSPKVVPTCLLVGLVLMVLVGQGIRKGHGDFNRSILSEQPALAVSGDWVYPKNLKVKSEISTDDKKIYVVDPVKEIDILFVGDSHVEQYSSRVKKLSLQTGKNAAFITHSGCLVIPGIQDNKKKNGKCTMTIDLLEKILEKDSIQRVVWGEMWGAYKHISDRLVFHSKNGENIRLDERGFELAMDSLRTLMKRYPNKEFYVLLDYPWDEGSYNPIKQNNRWRPTEVEHMYRAYPELEYWAEGNKVVRKTLDGTASLIETSEEVCPNKICDLMKYKDDDHLRSSYVEKNATWIDQVFE